MPVPVTIKATNHIAKYIATKIKTYLKASPSMLCTCNCYQHNKQWLVKITSNESNDGVLIVFAAAGRLV